MKITKKMLSLVLVGVVCVVWLTGCNNQGYTVGVVQLMEHKALDAAYQGFIDALADNGYTEGDNLTVLFENAQGDTSTLSTIADRLVSRNVDLVLSISTPSTQAIAAKTETIPILGTAVTSYTVAGLIDSDAAPGGNISGTSDMNPIAGQIDLIRELVPNVQTIGLIYNSSEDNSVLQTNIAKERIEALGLRWHEVTVTNPGDVQQAMQSLVGRCEAVYIPTDNTLASAMPAVHSIALEAKLPTVCGESNMVMEGGLATMGIDYYALGYMTGEMAVEVFAGANPGEMPIRYSAGSDEITINGLVAQEIGFVVPAKFADYVVFPE